MDNRTLIIKLTGLALLIVCVGFFTSSETAFISLPRVKLRTMVREKKKNAKLVLKLKQNMGMLLTTVLIGTNFLNSLISALSTALIIQLWGGGGVGFETIAVAFFITTFGQIIPKTIAVRHPDKIASFTSILLSVLQTIFFPVVWFFEKLSNGVVKLFEKILKPDSLNFTEDDLKTLIDVGEKEGTIEKDESRMLNKIIKFNDLLVSGIMKHRSFVSMVPVTATKAQVKEEFLKSGFSTITVYKDSKENVVGIINYKMILVEPQKIDEGKDYAQKKMHEVQYVPATLSVLELLQKFREETHKFAVVLNEQGATAGIVTMEDILRVVFGRMTDENDINNLPAENRIKVTSPDTFLVPGDVKIEELNTILKLNLESEDMNTLGGWLLEQFGSLPSSGMVIVKDKVLFTVEDVAQRRIISVKIKIS